MAKHIARMNANKRLFNKGKVDESKESTTSSSSKKSDDFLKSMIDTDFSEEDRETYIAKYFVVASSKSKHKGRACACCANRQLAKGKLGIKYTHLENFVKRLKDLEQRHAASACKRRDLRVSKTLVEDRCNANAKIGLFCPDCTKSGSFFITEIKDPRITGDNNFIQFKCDTFSKTKAGEKDNDTI